MNPAALHFPPLYEVRKALEDALKKAKKAAIELEKAMKAPLTIKDNDNAIMLSESIELMTSGLPSSTTGCTLATLPPNLPFTPD